MVGPRGQHAPLVGPPAQDVGQHEGLARADQRVEGGDGEDAQAAQGGLGRFARAG